MLFIILYQEEINSREMRLIYTNNRGVIRFGTNEQDVSTKKGVRNANHNPLIYSIHMSRRELIRSEKNRKVGVKVKKKE